jgi:non-canonical (house-cleaning) NTP pyrophosphatase
VFKSSRVSSTIVLGVPRDEDRENCIATSVVSYAQEVIKLSTMQYLRKTLCELKGTEAVVPPFMDPDIPRFESHRYPLHGTAVLLVIPTANKQKERILCDHFREQAPTAVNLHTITIPFDSGVGEQPYNEAGCLGAHNRVTNALRALHEDAYQGILKSKGIGTVIVASIESYVQTEYVPRPVDYGIIVIRNATTERTTSFMSWGTTIDLNYVNRARRFGFDGDPNFGRVTVGQIIAAHVPGVDKADWQVVLGGDSRYKLINSAIAQMEIPWGLE